MPPSQRIVIEIDIINLGCEVDVQKLFRLHSSQQAQPTPESIVHKGRSNLIEKLQQTFGGGAYYSDDEDSQSHSNSLDVPAAVTAKAKKRRKQNEDWYDVDDGFVDDSE